MRYSVVQNDIGKLTEVPLINTNRSIFKFTLKKVGYI